MPQADVRSRRARKINPVLRPSTPSSVAIHCTPRLCAIAQCFFRNAALRRPDALRTQTKHFFVQIEAAPQLLARVFRMPKTILWQRQARAWKPHLRWYRKPAAESDGRTESRKSRSSPSPPPRHGPAEPAPAVPVPGQLRISDRQASSDVPCSPVPRYLFLPEKIRRTMRSARAPANR